LLKLINYSQINKATEVASRKYRQSAFDHGCPYGLDCESGLRKKEKEQTMEKRIKPPFTPILIHTAPAVVKNLALKPKLLLQFVIFYHISRILSIPNP